MAVKKKQSTAVVKWDEELAKYAEQSVAMEANSGGGQFFSFKSGVLSWQDSPLPNNEMAVIILDTIMENVYYEGDYDPDNPSGPACFAFGRSEETMAPHDVVVNAGTAQCESCDGCKWNEFGSADKGKGKACKNTRRLAVIPAGKFARDGSFDLIEDVDHYRDAEIGFMKLPITSVKGFSSFVKQVANSLKRPPFGVVTRVAVVPDTKTQFRVVFEPLLEVPDELMEVIMSRHSDAESVIDFPYTPADEEERPAAKSKPTKKVVAKKRKY